MENIANLNESNFYKIADSLNISLVEETVSALRDFIDFAPFMSKIMSRLIEYCINNNDKYNKEIKEHIFANSSNPNVNLSRCIYATYLGANTNLKGLVDSLFDIYNDCSLETNELVKYNNCIEEFYAFTILNEFSYDKKECIAFLSRLPYKSVINAIKKDQTLFNISILVQMCRFYGFLSDLEKELDVFNKRNEIIAMIFINYYSFDTMYTGRPRNENIELEKSILIRLITGETLNYCLKVLDKKYLGLLLGMEFKDEILEKISHEEFQNKQYNTQEEFFKAFLALTSPSVSHFFSYLEFYKSKFVLDPQSQQLFIKMLDEFHSKNIGYLDIVKPRLIKFKIINQKNIINE